MGEPEYNAIACKYDEWCQEDMCMQKMCYYSTLAELEKEGVEGKTFLEVGCGPCPIGQRLVSLGAKKIIALDVSSGMLESARKNLSEMKIVDKFDFVCSNILDDDFQLPEKVDVVVVSYMLSACIDNYQTLAKFFSQCIKLIKEGGFLHITDFSWVRIPKDGFWLGEYTSFGTKDTDSPKEFEIFDFFMEKAPDNPMKIYNIPSYLMFKASCGAGFTEIEMIPQYTDPQYKDNAILRRYIDIVKATDYMMKFKVAQP